jgi:hypothetical protein
MLSGAMLAQAAEQPTALEPRVSSVAPGQAAKESAVDFGHSVREAAIQVGHGARVAASEVAQTAVKIGHAFRDAFRQIGQAFKRSDAPAPAAPVANATTPRQVASAPQNP